MNSLLQKFISRIMPFFILGIFLVLLVLGIMLMVHLLILGAVVGLVLFSIAWIREKLFPRQEITTRRSDERAGEHKGRTIDHDDLP